MKPTGWLPGTSARQPLGEPCAAGIDADERGVVRDRAAHALGERGERRFGVRRSCGPSRVAHRTSACRISCAATSSRTSRRRAAAPLRVQRAPARASRRPALVDERDRQAEAAVELAREALARAPSSRARCRRRAAEPTTSCVRLPLVDQRGDRREALVASARRRSWSADARRAISVLPTATPIRRVPKSNASTVASGDALRGHASRVPDVLGQAREVDAEQSHRGGQPPLGGRSNSTSGSACDREPRVLRELLLELARRPAGVAERDEHVAAGPRRGRPPRARPSTS